MVSEETVARLAVAPGRMLRDLRSTAKQDLARAERHVDLAEKVLAEKSGHGPAGEHGFSCLCGWYHQGGYPMDKQRAVWAHVEAEWEKVQ